MLSVVSSNSVAPRRQQLQEYTVRASTAGTATGVESCSGSVSDGDLGKDSDCGTTIADCEAPGVPGYNRCTSDDTFAYIKSVDQLNRILPIWPVSVPTENCQVGSGDSEQSNTQREPTFDCIDASNALDSFSAASRTAVEFDSCSFSQEELFMMVDDGNKNGEIASSWVDDKSPIVPDLDEGFSNFNQEQPHVNRVGASCSQNPEDDRCEAWTATTIPRDEGMESAGDGGKKIAVGVKLSNVEQSVEPESKDSGKNGIISASEEIRKAAKHPDSQLKSQPSCPLDTRSAVTMNGKPTPPVETTYKQAGSSVSGQASKGGQDAIARTGDQRAECNQGSLSPSPSRASQQENPSITVKGKKQIRQSVPCKPTPSDVLCARGGEGNNHEGNRKYLEFVNECKPEYRRCTKTEKTAVSRRVVEYVHSYGGRFLKQEGGRWFEVTENRARKKAGQALREDAKDEEIGGKREIESGKTDAIRKAKRRKL